MNRRRGFVGAPFGGTCQRFDCLWKEIQMDFMGLLGEVAREIKARSENGELSSLGKDDMDEIVRILSLRNIIISNYVDEQGRGSVCMDGMNGIRIRVIKADS